MGGCRRTLVAGGLLLIAGSIVHAADVPEVEPNDAKLTATTALLQPGDSISGITTGASTLTPGEGSADYFRIRTPAQAPGIYRRQMTLLSNPSGHTMTIRGRSQSGGIINLLSDVAVQTSVVATNPSRAVAWYGFGKQEEIFLRIAGAATTTSPYTVTIWDAPVTPELAAGTLFEGPITLAAAATGASTIDPDTWLYDADFNAVPTAGNDDIGGSGTAGPSQFTRVLTPGTYTLAVAPYQFMNDHPSPPDDDWRAGNVLDFPGAALGSVVNAAGSAQIGTVTVTISDGLNPTVSVPLVFTAGRIGEVRFAQFTVQADPNPVGACCRTDGSCEARTAARCAQVGGWYQGDQTACGAPACPPVGACCDSGGCCAITFQSLCPSTWILGSTCASNTCPLPLNDTCLTARPVTLDMPVQGSNCSALSTGDGAAATCQATAGKGVWFAFTPPTSGLYSISSCGTPQDTVLQVYTTNDCASLAAVICDDDTCDGVTPEGSSLAASIASASLTAGINYRIRLSSFGASPAGGPYQLVVRAVAPPGACCVGSCCSIGPASACTGTWFAGGTCAPNPCPIPTNDTCSAPRPLTLGVAVTGNNCNASNTGDGPVATCQSTAGKAVWFTFTPAHTAAYTVTSCGSTQDTVVQVFTSPDCTSFTPVACDDDTCDGVTPPGSGSASVINSVVLTAGTSYLVRLSSFSSSLNPTGGEYVLLVRSLNPLGACCTGSVCTSTDGTNCGGGVFTEGGVCSPNPCAPATGACCCGSTCSATTAAACAGTNQIYRGDNSVCNVFGTNNTAPCCFADYNQSSTVTVQDIFDFLAAYFGAENCADINASGAPLSVQDIFDFLGAYFAGCV